jgi:hypothetical protein
VRNTLNRTPGLMRIGRELRAKLSRLLHVID